MKGSATKRAGTSVTSVRLKTGLDAKVCGAKANGLQPRYIAIDHSFDQAITGVVEPRVKTDNLASTSWPRCQILVNVMNFDLESLLVFDGSWI